MVKLKTIRTLKKELREKKLSQKYKDWIEKYNIQKLELNG